MRRNRETYRQHMLIEKFAGIYDQRVDELLPEDGKCAYCENPIPETDEIFER